MAQTDQILMRLSCLVLALVLSKISSCSSALTTLYSWKRIGFVLPEDAPKYGFNEDYSATNAYLVEANPWQGPDGGLKVFCTTPINKGVPASLSVISPVDNINKLAPYPDLSWHRLDDCNFIVSVFRTAIDKNDRLWVMDTGLNTPKNERMCPPKLLCFDLHTNKLLGRFELPKGMYERNSLFITIKIDSRSADFNDTFAYMGDVRNHKLVVFSVKELKYWRVDSISFYPEPASGIFDIAGTQFDLMDGIYSAALSPNNEMLYYHALASTHECWVPTSILRNSSLFRNGGVLDINFSPRSFQISKGTRPYQSGAEDFTDDGILFFSLMHENALACWNSNLPYDRENIGLVAKDNERLQFISGLNIYKGKVWVTSSHYQKYMTGKMNYEETNFRIMTAEVDDLMRGTKCKVCP